MIPGIFNISIPQNATYNQNLTWSDSAGAVINLSTYTAKMQVRDEAGTVIIELSTSNNRITLAATSPNIVLHITEATLIALTNLNGIYDLLLKSAGGTTITNLLSGSFTIVPGVTVP